MNRICFVLSIFCCLILGACWQTRTFAAQRPVIFIVYDDLFDYEDQRDLHGIRIQTPHFDRLRARGVRFSNAFASIAVCNPSRSSFMTGQSPFRTTVHVPEPTQWNDVLGGQATITHMMKAAGYETYSTGKVFHNQTRPDQQAFFNEHFDHHFQHRGRLRLPAGKIAHATEDAQSDDRHVDWAIQQIKAYAGTRTSRMKPMFLSVGIIRPHRPFIAPKRFFDLYPKEKLNAKTSLPKEKADLADVSDFYKQFRLMDAYQNNLIKKGQVLDFVQGYLASTSYADWQLGRILDAVDANKNLTDASIILISDNGYHLGEKHTWNKFTLWEEAAKIPFLVVDPRLPAGTQCDVPVSLLDVAPTIATMGGVKSLDSFDGDDVVSIAQNPRDHRKRVAITSMIGSLSIRTRKYRLMLYNDGSVELYDVQSDPRELKNLAKHSDSQKLITAMLGLISSNAGKQGAVADALAGEVTGTDKTDTIFVVGNQTGVGGDGDDLYFVANGGRIIESPGGGIDTAFYADKQFEIPLGLEYVRTNLFNNNFTYEITGNAESNRVMVTSSRADIRGLGGDDVLISGNARDVIDGGEGDDFVWTTNGDRDTMIGGAGMDVVVGGLGSDALFSEQRPDDEAESKPKVTANSHGDLIIGGGLLKLSSADERLADGSLKLRGTSLVPLNGILFYRRGSECLISGTLIKDSPSRPKNFDVQRLSAILDRAMPEDFIVLAAGAGDQITGGASDDIIVAQNGDDNIDSGLGNDWVLGGGGNDTAHGSDGDDVIDGAAGDDKLYGDRGNDLVNGGNGNDLLSGGAGDDRLVGQGGDDRFVGGPGADQFTGGPGLDVFSFPAQESVDTITDFSPRDDKILLPKSSPLHGMTNDQIIQSHCKFENKNTLLGSATRGCILLKRSPNSLADAFVRQ